MTFYDINVILWGCAGVMGHSFPTFWWSHCIFFIFFFLLSLEFFQQIYPFSLLLCALEQRRSGETGSAVCHSVLPATPS